MFLKGFEKRLEGFGIGERGNEGYTGDLEAVIMWAASAAAP